MERYRRGRGKKAILGSHQKCWLWGRNLVLETLSAGRWTILELALSADLTEAAREPCTRLAQQAGVPVQVLPDSELTRRCRSQEHQGYLAKMVEFPYADAAGVLDAIALTPLLGIADGMQDPYNFGAIIRSAEVFGVHALFIGEKGQVGVTSMVARSSAGAVNRIPIARTPDLVELAGNLKARGVRVVAATEKARLPLSAFDFRGAVAIVIGNEGRGISDPLLRACDETLRIPQVGAIGSLNAAVAASIFFYEARRQRDTADA